MNAEFVLPLGKRELGGIVESIRRSQAKNSQSGQTQRTFSFLQAARDRKSGQARRKDAPLEYDRTPWETAGISRAAWYYKQAGKHTGPRGRPKKLD